MGEDGQGKMAILIFLMFFLIAFLPAITRFLAVTNFKLQAWHIGVVIVAIVIIWVISTYNKFVNLMQRIKQANGSIDVYLKQRFDLIPNIVETVKGYAKHEKEVLTAIVKLRQDYENRDENDIKQSQELNERYSNILALVESYPELKASESFLNLQKILAKIESQLQAARRIYNMEVTEYNTKRLKVPSNIIAAILGLKEVALFEITEIEREKVDTKF